MKNFFHHLDGRTVGNVGFQGSVGKASVAPKRGRVAMHFEAVAGKLDKFPDSVVETLGTDQCHPYHACHSVTNGSVPPSTHFGHYHHARRLTLANRALFLYMTMPHPNAKSKKLASFVVNVYAPLWFSVQLQNSTPRASKLFFLATQLVQPCPKLTFSDTESCKKTLTANAHYAHSEWILPAVLGDERPPIRAKAVAKIQCLQAEQHERPEEEDVRVFAKPTLIWTASEYHETIDYLFRATFDSRRFSRSLRRHPWNCSSPSQPSLPQSGSRKAREGLD